MSSLNCDDFCTQKDNDYLVTFITPLFLSLFYYETSLSLFWVMQASPKALWELVWMIQYESLISQHVPLLLLLNSFLSTVAVSGSSLLCGQTFLIIKKRWNNYARSQKMYVLPLLFSPEYRLSGTKLIFMRDSTCINWAIFQKLLPHFTEESPHLHRQMLVKGMEITDNSSSAWALTCAK